MCIHMCVWGVGVDVGLWREGGSATALTDFQAPPAETAYPPPPPPHPISPPLSLLTPAEADARYNRASTKQTQTPTVLLSTWLAAVVQDFLGETPCLYRNHNTVELQREAPAPLKTLLTTF